MFVIFGMLLSVSLRLRKQGLVSTHAFLFSRHKKMNNPPVLKIEDKIRGATQLINILRADHKNNIREEEEEEPEINKKEGGIFGNFDKKPPTVGTVPTNNTNSSFMLKLVVLGLGVFFTFHLFLRERDWSYEEWLQYAKQGKFVGVQIYSKQNSGYRPGKEKTIDVVVGFMANGKEIKSVSPNLESTLQELSRNNIRVSFKVNREFIIPSKWLDYLIPGLILWMWFSGYRGSMGSVSKGAVKYKPVQMKNKIAFKDVAGQIEAKKEIMEFVEFLKKPKKFLDMGAKIPKGALLTGPPGTGKTLLAKACAGEAGVPFFYLSGSEFIEKYVGVGASRIRDLFNAANAKSPCIVFIDEIDAIGKKRSSGLMGNSERDGTLNQLLVCMDGFETNSKVIVMGATNRKDMLDSALLRPGRFDRIIEVSLPDMEERKEIVGIYLNKVVLDPDIKFNEYARRVALMSPGFSGADLANLCNEAAIRAARESSKYVRVQHFEEAADRILTGFDKTNTLSKSERKLIAMKESATAVTNWFLEGGDPVIKVTILPRSKSELGSSHFLPNENHLYSKEDIMDKISCALAGRAIQELLEMPMTSFSASSLFKVKSLSEALVKKYGMSSSHPNIAFPDSEIIKKPFSEETEVIMEKDIEKIIEESSAKAKKVLLDHLPEVKKLAELLGEKETLLEKDIKEVLGPRPYAPKSNYKAFLEAS